MKSKGYGKTKTPGDKDWQAMRAIQYMNLRMGVELPINYERFSASEYVKFSKAKDGSRRVQFVLIGKDWHEVPDWDFVEKCEVFENSS